MLKCAYPKKNLQAIRWIFTGLFGMIFFAVTAEAAETQRHYDPGGRRDPFIPLIAGGARPSGSLMSVEVPEDLILEGIAYDPAGSIVVVNGTMLKQGEQVGNTRLLRVDASRAVFEVNGVQVTKEVNPNLPGEA